MLFHIIEDDVDVDDDDDDDDNEELKMMMMMIIMSSGKMISFITSHPSILAFFLSHLFFFIGWGAFLTLQTAAMSDA